MEDTEETDEAEDNLEQVKKKSLAKKSNFGISFSTNTSKKSAPVVKSGRTFN